MEEDDDDDDDDELKKINILCVILELDSQWKDSEKMMIW